ncbi:MAG: hemolysin family protein [Bacteroidetes bacterium]|uniref:hemolysin family protein n=1 Tax=Phnomibacter sp. TaxID=2836217 RepID=UPI002FDE3FDC|nr:hemolysin family protein [Bacteroidota bacterium]
MYIAILIIALLLTGFFAGMEIAFISANKLSIELKKKRGNRSGMIISRFLENPSRFIGVCLMGFNIFLVLYGLVASDVLSQVWQLLGIHQLDQSGTLSVVINVVIAATLVLLFEFIFKAIFRAKSEALIHFFAPVILFFYRIFDPISILFVNISTWILKYIFNVQVEDPKRPFSRIDLEHYFQQTKESEEDQPELNQELFENALSLPGVKIRNCLVPRKEIIGIDIRTNIHTVTQKMVDTKLSKLVVYDGNIDNILGYVHQLDLFKNPTDVSAILISIPAVPESMSVSDLINKLTRERKSMAWVVDEFGGTAGVVTMEDLLEEIFGEIHDEYDTDEFVEKQLAEGEFMFSGRLELDYLNEKYQLDFERAESSETLSGFVINHHDVLPRQGDRIIIGNYQFEILNMSDTRIELLKLKLL